jgi:betaine-aldehyde dehydrogenase
LQLNTQSTVDRAASPARANDANRRQLLIEVTIDSLAELGPLGTTLAQIAGKAGVSPGLVAHYFADKDGLLAAAFRALVARVNQQLRWRLAGAGTPRERIRAIIDAHLSPEEFDERIGRAWLAFWGQVPQVESLARVQKVYQRRLISNLRSSLKRTAQPDRRAGRCRTRERHASRRSECGATRVRTRRSDGGRG